MDPWFLTGFVDCAPQRRVFYFRCF
jgi:hypothetical protein